MGGDVPAVFQTGVSSPNAPHIFKPRTLKLRREDQVQRIPCRIPLAREPLMAPRVGLCFVFGLVLRRSLARTLGLRPGSLQRPRLLFRGPHSACDRLETVVHHLVEVLWASTSML
jgi:hypothetical protein